MSRYAVRIVGPSGMETYLLPDGTEGPQEAAKAYKTNGLACIAGRVYSAAYPRENFTYDVVNLDDPEDRA
jgi:hypothetical protein